MLGFSVKTSTKSSSDPHKAPATGVPALGPNEAPTAAETIKIPGSRGPAARNISDDSVAPHLSGAKITNFNPRLERSDSLPLHPRETPTTWDNVSVNKVQIPHSSSSTSILSTKPPTFTDTRNMELSSFQAMPPSVLPVQQPQQWPEQLLMPPWDSPFLGSVSMHYPPEPARSWNCNTNAVYPLQDQANMLPNYILTDPSSQRYTTQDYTLPHDPTQVFTTQEHSACGIPQEASKAEGISQSKELGYWNRGSYNLVDMVGPSQMTAFSNGIGEIPQHAQVTTDKRTSFTSLVRAGKANNRWAAPTAAASPPHRALAHHDNEIKRPMRKRQRRQYPQGSWGDAAMPRYRHPDPTDAAKAPAQVDGMKTGSSLAAGECVTAPSHCYGGDTSVFPA